MKTDRKENHLQEKIIFSINREQFARIVYPVLAGVPTAIFLLYILDFGETVQNILNNLISPIITGVVSGFILYFLGLKR